MYMIRKGNIDRAGKPVVAPSNAHWVCILPSGPAWMAGYTCHGHFETHPAGKLAPLGERFGIDRRENIVQLCFLLLLTHIPFLMQHDLSFSLKEKE